MRLPKTNFQMVMIWTTIAYDKMTCGGDGGWGCSDANQSAQDTLLVEFCYAKNSPCHNNMRHNYHMWQFIQPPKDAREDIHGGLPQCWMYKHRCTDTELNYFHFLNETQSPPEQIHSTIWLSFLWCFVPVASQDKSCDASLFHKRDLVMLHCFTR